MSHDSLPAYFSKDFDMEGLLRETDISWLPTLCPESLWVSTGRQPSSALSSGVRLVSLLKEEEITPLSHSKLVQLRSQRYQDAKDFDTKVHMVDPTLTWGARFLAFWPYGSLFWVLLVIGFTFLCGFGHRVQTLGHLPQRVHTFELFSDKGSTSLKRFGYRVHAFWWFWTKGWHVC